MSPRAVCRRIFPKLEAFKQNVYQLAPRPIKSIDFAPPAFSLIRIAANEWRH
jgi:hypothetical protein